MTEQISQKIDLRNTQEEKNLLGSLSQEEKKSIVDALNKYREEKKESEKLWIIVLTHQEIENLKQNIWNQQSVNEFLDTQLRETITTSEILSGTSIEKNLWWKDNLEKFTQASEKIMYNYLFSWSDSLFWHLWLSEDAKQNLTVWFNFFVFDFLNKNKENFNIEKNIEFVSNNIWNLLDGNLSSLEWILSIWDKGSEVIDNLKNSFWILGGKLNIVKTELNKDIFTNSGENNEIFMNPNESLIFFNGILDGSIINVQNYVTQKQTNTPIVIEEWDFANLKNIGEKWWNLIPESIGTKLGAMSDIFSTIEDYKETVKLGLEKSPKFLEVLAWLENFPIIWSLVKFFWDLLWISSFEDMFENSQFWEIKKDILTLFTTDKLIISNAKVPENFMKSGNNNDLDFLRNLKSLGNWENDYKKILEKLLKNWWDFDNFQKFLVEKNLIKSLLNNEKLNYESLSKAVKYYEEYMRYKSQNPQITFEEFAVEIEKKEKEEKAAMQSFKEIPKQESFEKDSNKISATCEVNGKWYEISWNKHGEIQLQSNDKKYFYFVDSIKWSNWILSMPFTNNDFYEQHSEKINIDAVKSIIPLLLNNNTVNDILNHKVTSDWKTVEFTIKTINVVEKSVQLTNSHEEEKWVSTKEKKSSISVDQEKLVWDFYTYKTMKLSKNFWMDSILEIVDKDGNRNEYKLNIKYGIDMIYRTLKNYNFEVKNSDSWYALVDTWNNISVNLKELYNKLFEWINSADIEGATYDLIYINNLELEKVN